MSMRRRFLAGPLHRWSFLLLPILAIALTACGTGGTSGGIGY
jgi:hypothetical protein